MKPQLDTNERGCSPTAIFAREAQVKKPLASDWTDYCCPIAVEHVHWCQRSTYDLVLGENPRVDPELRKELREHAWTYFARHAEQRLKTFNFYLILVTAIIAGGLAFERESDQIANGWPLAFLLSLITFVFWKLDVRVRFLVKHSEEALKVLEDELPLNDEANGLPHRCKLFRREEAESSKLKRFPDAPLANAHFSYTSCFLWIFSIFGYGGFVFGVVLLGLALYGGQK